MTQPLVPAILAALDTCRTIPGRLGLRVFTVTVRRRVHSGGSLGDPGTFVDTDTPLINVASDRVTAPVRVTAVTRSDIIASGNRYVASDLRVGPMTPAFAATIFGPGAGYTDAGTMDPTPVTTGRVEMFWIVNGPNLATNSIFEKVGDEATAMHYVAVIRSTGQQIT